MRDVDTVPSAARPAPSPDEAAVLATLASDEPQHIEDVIMRSEMVPSRVAATLMTLELSGRARQLEGQRWILVDGPRRA